MPNSKDPCKSCPEGMDRGASFCSSCGAALGGPTLRTQTPLSFGSRHRTGTASWLDLQRMLVFYGLLLTCSLIFGVIYHAKPGPYLDVVFMGISALIVGSFLINGRRSVARAFKFKRPKPKTLLELLGVCIVVVLFLNAYFAAFTLIGWPMIRMTESFTQAHWPTWSIFVIISIMPGVIEEVAFRGILQTKLSEILSAKEALIIQAALFSVLHLSPVIFISHFVMGLLLGWVRLRTGHVYFGIILHMTWNAMVVLKELT